MDQVHVIRHKVLVEKVPARQVAREMGVSRNTVRRYVEGAPPGVRKTVARPRPVYDAVVGRMEQLLTRSSAWTGGKQRLTAARLHELLRGEGFSVGASLVRDYVREWKRRRQEVFVPLVYRPGDLGEIDFFEVLADVAGQRQKAHLFLMRPMFSGRDFAWLFPRQDQVCFFEGHVRAFAHLGGVPHRLLYDNLRPAVRRIVGSQRELSPRFEALASHYLFESCFARPATGHDKGGVESRGRAVRLSELVPIPAGPDLDTISRALMERLDARAATTRDRDGRTVLERFAEEQAAMLPLPAAGFRSAAVRLATVSRRSLVQIEGAWYSAPCQWAGLEVTAYVGVSEVELVGPLGRVSHPRQRLGQRSVDYRHYLPELARKPQAVRQVAPELTRDLGEPFGRAWQELVDCHGPREAARIFARVLQSVVDRGRDSVAETIELALASGEPLLLALLTPPTPAADLPSCDIPDRLKAFEVLAARVADFDALLGGGR